MGSFRDLVPVAKPITVHDSALVVIDLNNFCGDPEYGLAKTMERIGVDLSAYWQIVHEETIPNVLMLLEAWRDGGGRIAFVRVGGQLTDYGDSLIHLRPSHVEGRSLRGTTDFEVISALAPRLGEIVVDKSGFGAFTSSNLDVLLRNAGISSIVMTGVSTNACVLVSALGAFDLGYSVHVVSDACAAAEERQHDTSLKVMEWLGLNIVTTKAVMSEIAETPSDSRSGRIDSEP